MNQPQSLLESLADLEHHQRLHWSQATTLRVPKSVRARWHKSWRPCAALPGEAQEPDCVWTGQVLKLLRELGVPLPP